VPTILPEGAWLNEVGAGLVSWNVVLYTVHFHKCGRTQNGDSSLYQDS